ncbi:hypothetical protein ONZ43_g237 [Nemania bipapillata]|uniref:Uncharacterized protein n=1 Tax=Nemania bipapillata TaxID=110536 RepID=A0ACC2J954_9PEZI|nr:hypothetical protein ONZ43_g237 [Nemania bipapillata]
MAPLLDQVRDLIQKRYVCPSGSYLNSYGQCVRGSTWYCCLNSRRRRRQGQRPMYGTGWMASNGQYYQNPPQAYQPPPPAYGAQSYPMDNRYATTDGPYGQQSSGIEPPKNVYSGDYAPPSGPPPNK